DGDGGHTQSIGVLKSTDGGETWLSTGLVWTISSSGVRGYKLLMHPTSHNTLFTVSTEGIHKTTDGGSSWSTISGANSDQFNPLSFTQTTSFKRIATSTLNSVVCSAESNVLTYVVNTSPTVAAITSPGGVTDICLGSTLQLSDATTGGIWSSDNPTVASVNSSTGLVTALSVGSLNLNIHYTVTDGNGCSTTRNKTVNVLLAISSFF
ncbi:Ig-like domain-containing protein, partial [bacterium]|nr:Ig-like domain-containing protein [bacterium]